MANKNKKMKFSDELPFPLEKKKSVPFYIEMVIDYGRKGHSLDVFLFDFNIRRSKWEIFAKKHKEIRLAIADAEYFAKAVALSKVNKLMKNKEINGVIAKMYLEQCAGWTTGMDLSLNAPPTIIIQVGKTTKQLQEEEEENS